VTTDATGPGIAALSGLSAHDKRALLADQLRRQHRQRFRASFSQERLWFLSRLMPDSTAYHLGGAVRIGGPLDLAVWRRSCQEILLRHEALRTGFEEVDGELVQVVAGYAEANVSIVDCAYLVGAEPDDQLYRLAHEEFARPFDLSEPPLLRQRLLRIAAEDHILLFTLHHIVADQWSMAIFIDEVFTAYAASIAGSELVLPRLPIQYPDFAAWQRERIDRGTLDEDLAYWTKALTGAPPALELPTDRPRPTIPTSRGGSSSFILPGPVMDRLRALGRQTGATTFMTLLAAFQVLLHRYSRQDDVVVGVPVTNRGHAETDRLVGLLVNLLAVRTDLSGGPTFRELIGRVRRVCLDAYAHPDVPFERLVEELQPRRDPSRTPVFQVFFILTTQSLLDVQVPGLRVSPVPVPSATARFDLELRVFDGGAEAACVFEYNRDLFDAATIEGMSARFQVLVANLVTAPDEPIGSTAMLTIDEQRQLLHRGSPTTRVWPDPVLAHARFESRVAISPDAAAVAFDDDTMSYRELDRRANQLARRLKRLGVDPEVRVGIFMRRSLDMVVALLAVLKSGGAFVPLDPEHPADRIAFMLDDSGPSVVLTEPDLLGRLPTIDATVLCPADIRASLDTEASDSPGETVRGEHLAYLIYTSGSTGRPKGVLTTHGALANLLLAMAERFGTTHDDVMLAVNTLSFDVALLDLLLPLTHGARVVLASDAVAADSERLADLLTDSGATMMQATPTRFRMLLDAGWTGANGFRVLVGGEALPPALARRLRSLGVRLWNLYGLTEAGIWSSVARVDGGPITLGEPLANTELHVVEAGGSLAPPGVPGELYLGGAGLGRAYHARPELTAQRFVERSLAGEPARRLLRTGDVALRRPNGTIEFIGRLDHQVKLRGFRIELGEIESVLASQPGVRQAVVVMREETDADQRLVSYVVLDDAAGVSDAEKAAPVAEPVDQWRQIWDTAYRDGAGDAQVDPSFDIRGWNSRYTGHAMSGAEMREWVDRTVESVLDEEPGSVLEVGCGTGLILLCAAPRCERYWGTDISHVALERLGRLTAAPGSRYGQVRLFDRAADQLDDLPSQLFDLVVLNSVAQYFPDVTYLLRVVEQCLARLAPGGRVLIGDVRSLPLHECLHASVVLSGAERLSVPEAVERVRRRVDSDEELVIDPRFFTALRQRFPQITDVRVMPKRGRLRTEMTSFRYTVLLRTGVRAEETPCQWVDWTGQGLSLEALRDRLAYERPDVLALSGVPNARLDAQARLAQAMAGFAGSVAALRHEVGATGTAAVDPEDLYAVAADANYRLDLDWSRHGPDGGFAAVLRRCDHNGRPVADLPASEYAAERAVVADASREPAWHTFVNGRRRAATMIPRLRAGLAEKLPDYMVPSAFVLLDRLPLTTTGKVDRAALPAPDPRQRQARDSYVAPRTAVEMVIARIWSWALGLERVGVHDNFFELGGYSLLSTRIIFRVREALGVDVPLHRMFDNPTVAGLAGTLVSRHGDPHTLERAAEQLLTVSGRSDSPADQATAGAGTTTIGAS
jgi:amino acid adenylation domain-containing protein